MSRSTCSRCGRLLDALPHAAKRPADLDPAAWDAYIAGACGDDDERINDAYQRGVSFIALLEIQSVRHANERAEWQKPA